MKNFIYSLLWFFILSFASAQAGMTVVVIGGGAAAAFSWEIDDDFQSYSTGNIDTVTTLWTQQAGNVDIDTCSGGGATRCWDSQSNSVNVATHDTSLANAGTQVILFQVESGQSNRVYA
ncbi:MAG: hypothetical protein ACW987_20920, partial [Candidatus Thorarchaeota archaeon]